MGGLLPRVPTNQQQSLDWGQDTLQPQPHGTKNTRGHEKNGSGQDFMIQIAPIQQVSSGHQALLSLVTPDTSQQPHERRFPLAPFHR